MKPSESERPPTADLWHAFAGELRRYLRRRVEDHEVAEDLLQEVFVRVHRSLDGLEDPARAGPWITRIAKNLVADHHRARKTMTTFTELADPSIERGDDLQAMERLLGAWVATRIDALPPHESQAIRAVHIEGRSQAELARELGISASGLKSRVQRGRARLRGELDACCSVELGATGRVLDFEPKSSCEADCC